MNNKTLAANHARAIGLLLASDKRNTLSPTESARALLLIERKDWEKNATATDATVELLNDIRFRLTRSYRLDFHGKSEGPAPSVFCPNAAKVDAFVLAMEKGLTGLSALSESRWVDALALNGLNDIFSGLQNSLICDGWSFFKNDRGYFIVSKELDESGARARLGRKKKK